MSRPNQTESQPPFNGTMDTPQNSTLLQEGLRAYRIFDDRIVIMSESEELSMHMHQFLKLLEIPCAEPARETIRLAVFVAPQNQFLLCCPEMGVADRVAGPRPAWMSFRRLFMDIVMNEYRPHFCMHASCVATRDGRAAVIAGSSDSGKTSILIGLLKQGYLLASDDYTPLHLSDGQIRALPVGVTASDQTFDMFSDLEDLKSPACRFRAGGQYQWTINLGDKFPSVAPYAPLAPTHLFFIKPAFGKESKIYRVATEEACWRMQESHLAAPPTIPPFGSLSEEYREQVLALSKRMAAEPSVPR